MSAIGHASVFHAHALFSPLLQMKNGTDLSLNDFAAPLTQFLAPSPADSKRTDSLSMSLVPPALSTARSSSSSSFAGFDLNAATPSTSPPLKPFAAPPPEGLDFVMSDAKEDPDAAVKHRHRMVRCDRVSSQASSSSGC